MSSFIIITHYHTETSYTLSNEEIAGDGFILLRAGCGLHPTLGTVKYVPPEGDTSHLGPGTADLSSALLFTGIHAADQAVIFSSGAARLIDNLR